MPSSPFQFDTYQPQSIGQMVALMMAPAQARAAAIRAGGNAQADAAQASGRAWSGAAGTIGAIAAGIPAQLEERKNADAERTLRAKQGQLLDQQIGAAQQTTTDRRAIDDAMRSGGGVRERVMAALAAGGNGHLAPEIQKAFDVADESAAKAAKARRDAEVADVEYFGHLATEVKAAGYNPQIAALALAHAKEKGFDTSAIEQQLSAQPGALQQVVDGLIARAAPVQAGTKTPTREVKTLNADGSETLQIIEDKPGFTATSAAPKLKATAEDWMAATPEQRKQIEAAWHAESMAKRPPEAAGGQAGPSDIVLAVQGMKEGTLPPQMPGRASKDYTAIMAEAKRQGYDLAGAATDWAATQKHIATMNGAQQLRLNQAVNALPEMLDSVDALAAQWKGGRFPVLNKVNLAAAKAGAYGDEVASVANRLDAQIADVVADLGNVYMGGNSPTDHALELAGKSLKAEWSAATLKDMVKLAKQNVQIRRNSINSTGVQGASADNPYAPKPAVEAPPAARPGVPSYQDYLRSRGGK